MFESTWVRASNGNHNKYVVVEGKRSESKLSSFPNEKSILRVFNLYFCFWPDLCESWWISHGINSVTKCRPMSYYYYFHHRMQLRFVFPTEKKKLCNPNLKFYQFSIIENRKIIKKFFISNFPGILASSSSTTKGNPTKHNIKKEVNFPYLSKKWHSSSNRIYFR